MTVPGFGVMIPVATWRIPMRIPDAVDPGRFVFYDREFHRKSAREKTRRHSPGIDWFMRRVMESRVASTLYTRSTDGQFRCPEAGVSTASDPPSRELRYDPGCTSSLGVKAMKATILMCAGLGVCLGLVGTALATRSAKLQRAAAVPTSSAAARVAGDPATSQNPVGGPGETSYPTPTGLWENGRPVLFGGRPNAKPLNHRAGEGR